MDKEVRLLDTRVPYFYSMIRDTFLEEPKDIEIVVVGSKKEFSQLTGKEGVACTKDNKIFILEPNKFSEQECDRDDFYRVLYQELIHLFYLNKRI